MPAFPGGQDARAPRIVFPVDFFRRKMRISFHSPKTVFEKHRCYAAVILVVLTLSGCCIETKNKPGVVVRGDWAFELNRSRAMERSSEWNPYAYESDDCGSRKTKGHQAPCGRWGCLICALGPSAGEEDSETGEEKKPLTVTPPQYLGQYPMFHPGLPHPGISPLYAGVPGFGVPFGSPLPPPVQVINPRTGQQLLMQPVMPGQPGVLMLHAQNGQPVMVNPMPPLPTQFPSPLPPLLAGAPLPMQQPGMMPPGMVPAGIQPPYGLPLYGSPFPPNVPPAMSPWGMAMVDPNTGQLIPNPYAPPPQGSIENQTAEKTGTQETSRSQMPTPRFHAVPTQPVFQRTAGLATTKEAEEEQRLRQLKLERALGMKVPEGAKIAPNGVNQQILQTGAATGKGGGPVNGSPFSSINEALGLRESESRFSFDPAQKNYLKTQEQQILLQKAQIAGLQRKLHRSRNASEEYVVMNPPNSYVASQVKQKSLWSQLFDSSIPVGAPVRLPVHHEMVIEGIDYEAAEFVEGEWIEEETYIMPLQSIPDPPPLKPSRSKSFSPTGWLAPSADAERAAFIAMQKHSLPAQKGENLLTKAASHLTPPWMGAKSQTATKVQRPVGVNPLLRQESEPNPILQVSQTQSPVAPLAIVSTEWLLEEEWEEDEELPPLLSNSLSNSVEPAGFAQLQFHEERQPICPDGNAPRKNAPAPHLSRPRGTKPNAPPVFCDPPAPISPLSAYGKR